MIKLVLVDDHEVVRKGLKALFEEEEDIEVIGEAVDGKAALEVAELLRPDMMLLDLNMPNLNGIETAKILSKTHPKIKILVFSMHNNEDYVVKSIQNGVDGYLLKDSDKDEIMKAIHTIYNGQKYFPHQISGILVGALQSKGGLGQETGGKIKSLISKKEIQILKLIAEGQSSKEIAESLELSIRTVSNHRANMLKKTGLSNTAELIQKASKEGLLSQS
ncbi:response regulator [Emticicia sp. CRIBPO]|uniref:response regulator n=1 Tax=Emticicia sp. CRIBPO TaxID=2683258 RepID=UPI001411DA54|nr:response regulator transcription factor [Emticicia sp. CRIBPO]NBA88121.1 response regulator [Emticicia sp. CRIBPO]